MPRFARYSSLFSVGSSKPALLPGAADVYEIGAFFFPSFFRRKFVLLQLAGLLDGRLLGWPPTGAPPPPTHLPPRPPGMEPLDELLPQFGPFFPDPVNGRFFRAPLLYQRGLLAMPRRKAALTF